MSVASTQARPLRVGLVGLGDAGAHHARALTTLDAKGVVRWIAVCGRDQARTAAARARLDVPATVATHLGLEAMLSDGACDVAVLATPDGLHVEQVVASAQAGLHVLVEKPLALDAASAARALGACQEAGRTLRVGYHLRHHAGHRYLHLHREQLIGRLRHIEVSWAWSDPAVQGWRAKGRQARFWSLAALGVHGIDLARWFAGESPRAVVGVRTPSDDIDLAADICLAFEAGVHAHIAVAVTHRAPPRLCLVGDEGSLECLDTLGARGAGTILHRRGRGAAVEVEFEAVDPYEAQLRAFVAAVGLEERASDEVLDVVDTLDRLTEHV